MRILDKDTLCPDCGTGMCYYKQMRDGHINYFCGCRQTIWRDEYPEIPCTNKSCADTREEVEQLSKAIEDIPALIRGHKSHWQEPLDKFERDQLLEGVAKHIEYRLTELRAALKKEGGPGG